ncbi:Sensory/regulatory protein RpfC [Thiorhodovibrio winogradskyi]|uniref:histidine kinase n=1 Tax=Thiorhodovibrio winogradskyi TaxID=77007 RepID=A0ABZ0S8W7_9GAMM|nr:ATP-binding protein [Thiorhodovibrio winogradskyi]
MERLARLGAILVLLQGMAVIIGWHLKLPWLIQVLSELVPMQYNTALGLLLTAVGLWAVIEQRRALVLGAAVLVGLLGLLTLAQYLLGIDLGIDQLLMAHFITVGTPDPGRMAPNTALSFVLIAAILLLMSGAERSWRWILAGIAAGILTGLGTVALLGYLLDLPSAYGWARLTEMAPQTALNLAVLGAAMIALVWRRGRSRETWVFAVVAILLATINLALWQSLQVSPYQATQDRAAWLVLVFGLTMALAVAGAVTLAIRSHRVATQLAQDIAQRLAAEASLRETEQSYQQLFESSQDALMTVTFPDWSFRTANRATLRLFRAESLEQFTTLGPWDVSPERQPDGRLSSERIAVLLQQAMETGSAFFEWQHRRLDGELVDTDVLLTRMERHGQPFVQATIRDITARKIGEREILRLNADLEARVASRTAKLRAALKQAQSAVEAKSLFLANMSHEIRTPMNAILGLAYLLERQELPAEARELARKLRGSGQSLLGIINDILDFSKIESGKIELERVPFRLATVLQDLTTLMTMTAQEKARHRGQAQRLELAIIPPDGDDWLLRGDPLRLGQILTNLTSNAIKFTDAGRVEIRVEPIDTSATQVRLRFTVSDTGIGIDRAIQPRMFDAFMQADTSTTRRFGGSGLGLPICRRLVELMGGRMGLDSTPGVGSSFWFELSFERLSEDAGLERADTPAAASEQAPTQALAGLRLLVADDSDINREVAERIFTDQGAAVHCVDNGQEAVDWLLAHPGAADLVLMDVQMPVLDGRDATRAIRQHPQFARLPIVALSAGALPEQEQAAHAAGMNAFLPKPFDVERALALIRQLTGQEANPEQLAVAQQAAPPSDSEPAMTADLPGLAVDRALAIWKDAEVYRRYLRKFAAEQADVAERIAAAAPREARRLAHKLKGAAVTLGLDAVAAAAAALDQLHATDATTEQIAVAGAALQVALETALASIAAYTAEPVAVAPLSQGVPHQLDVEVIRPWLRAAHSAFGNFDPIAAEPAVSQLARHLRPQSLTELQQAIDNLDAAAGEAAVCALAKQLGIELETA